MSKDRDLFNLEFSLLISPSEIMRTEIDEDCVMFISGNESSNDLEMDEVLLENTISPRFRKRAFDLVCTKVSILPVTIILAIIAVVSMVGQNAVLPLWIDSNNAINIDDNSTFFGASFTNNSRKHSLIHNVIQSKFKTDSYFIVALTSFTMLITLGLILLVIFIFFPDYIGETEKKFPQKYMLCIGACGGTTSILLVYASSGERTAPYLQAILGNFMIPMTLVLRFFLIHKLPTCRKFVSSMVVVMSLFICLIPTVFPQIDPSGERDLGGQESGPGHFLWPLCFMIGFIPVALINVIEEKALKIEEEGSCRQVNLFYFLFCCCLYEVATVVGLFWTDMIPGFGNSDGYDNFVAQWVYNTECFFGGANCASSSTTLGIIFLLFVLSTNLAISFLLRYSEGALLVAIVSALVTPLSFIFWTLFEEVPFRWNPRLHITTWFSIGSVLLMCPGIFFYNTGETEQTGMSDNEVVQLHEGFGDYEDRDPLVIDDIVLEDNHEIATTNL